MLGETATEDGEPQPRQMGRPLRTQESFLQGPGVRCSTVTTLNLLSFVLEFVFCDSGMSEYTPHYTHTRTRGNMGAGTAG